MTDLDADAFAREWVSAWNAHDVTRVLDHFAADATFTSPLACRIVPDCEGVLRGKQAIAAYWHAGIAANPELQFELTGVYVGIECMVISFRNELGVDRIEILHFQGGLVVAGHGTFPPQSRPSGPTEGMQK